MADNQEREILERCMGVDHTDAPAEHGWIQWKGTDVCIDLHCECGELGHFDGEHLYFWRCGKCKKAYYVGQVVKLIGLTDGEAHIMKDRIQESNG
jgi:hypothetical protein